MMAAVPAPIRAIGNALLLGAALMLAGNARAAEEGAAIGKPSLHLSHRVISDGLSQHNPKALPGSTIEYELAVSDFAAIPAIDNIVSITAPVPARLTLIVSGSDAGLPAYQIEGHGTETIAPCAAQAAMQAGDCIAYSNDGGRSYDYRPTPDIDGVDRQITHFRFNIRTINGRIPVGMARLMLRYRMIME